MPQTANLMEYCGGSSGAGGSTSSRTLAGEGRAGWAEAKAGRADTMLATEAFLRKSRRGINEAAMRSLVMKLGAGLEMEEVTDAYGGAGETRKPGLSPG